MKKESQERVDQRNHLNSKSGQGKNAFGIRDIQTKRRNASESWIGVIFLTIDLIFLANTADMYAIFCALFKNGSRHRMFLGAIEDLVWTIYGPLEAGYRKIPAAWNL